GRSHQVMKNSEQAFALLELIVALTILGVGFSVLFASISGSTRNIERLEKFQHREQRVENLFAQLDLAQRLPAGDSARGTFDDGTRWRIEVEPFAGTPQDANRLLRIQLRLEWDGKSGLQIRNIETYRLARTTAALPRGLDDQLHELQ